MKKTLKLMLANLLLLTLLLALTSCKPPKIYHIGVVLSTDTNPFFIDIAAGITQTLAQTDHKLTLVYSQDQVIQEQEHVQTLIDKAVDLIIINPTNSDSVFKAISLANSENIPVITVDRRSQGGVIVSHVGSDNILGGQLVAQAMIDLHNNSGKYAELKGIEGTSAARDRGQGFTRVMTNQSQMILTASLTADFDHDRAYEATVIILEVHPDLQSIFAHNDEMALGALKAIEEDNLVVTVFGFDGISKVIEAVDQGKIYATVVQQPHLMGQIAIESALDYLSKGDIETDILVPVKLYTQ